MGGEDEGTERRGSAFWCGWDGKMNIEDNCGSQWVCRTRGYPTSLLDTAFSKASQIPRSETLTNPVTNVTENNFKVRDMISKNFHILKNDPETSSIFSSNPLVSF